MTLPPSADRVIFDAMHSQPPRAQHHGWLLFVTYASGHTSMLKFETARDLELARMLLSSQPVQLAMAEY